MTAVSLRKEKDIWIRAAKSHLPQLLAPLFTLLTEPSGLVTQLQHRLGAFVRDGMSSSGGDSGGHLPAR
jgi:hypothetical protein